MTEEVDFKSLQYTVYSWVLKKVKLKSVYISQLCTGEVEQRHVKERDWFESLPEVLRLTKSVQRKYNPLAGFKCPPLRFPKVAQN